MEEQIERLTKRLCSLPRDVHLEELKCFEEHICQCTPILQMASEKRNNVWKLLQVIGQFPRQQIKLNATWQFILEALNRMAFEYEKWPIVEEYAKEVVVDWEMHAMGVKARRLACRIEGKKCHVESKLTVRLGGKGRVIADDGHYRSACGLTAGIHFYEVLILEEEEKIAVGWTTRGWTGGRYEVVDREERVKQGIDPIDGQHCITFHDTFPAGTVLGCLLDVSKKMVAFYVNGQPIEFTSEVHFSPGAYYVQVYLPCSPSYNAPSLLYFNFGQLPFKYRPPQFQQLSPFWRAHSPVRYALYNYDDVISMPVFDNRVEPWFSDAKQLFVKEAIERLLNKGEMTIERVAQEYGQLRERVQLCKETHTWRWAQAMIEMKNIPESKMNAWASLVDVIVELTADKFSLQFEHFLTPYSKLQVPTGGANNWIHRNLIILTTANVQFVVHFAQNEKWFNNLFHAIFSFFLSAFLSTDDPCTVIFALIALQGYKIKGIFKLLNREFKQKLRKWKEKLAAELTNVWQALNSKHTPNWCKQIAYYQIQLLIHQFESPSATPPSATFTTLNSLDCSPYAKFSSDYLSLRSDWQWQSARSHLSVDDSQSLRSPVFYFEVLLLTSGPMRIGWATGRSQIRQREIGSDEFSVAYDGHSLCVWHQGVQFRVKNCLQWKPGDIIGCLLDFTRKQFTFYQNGERIETNGDIFSAVSRAIVIGYTTKVYPVFERNDSFPSETQFFLSTHPYHAALSLGPYQQCTVNFGQAFFRYPPKCVDIWDFQQYGEHLERHRVSKRPKLGNITLSNSILAVDGSSIQNRDIVNGPVTTQHSNSTHSPSFTIQDTSFCGVCKRRTNIRLRQLKDCSHLAFCRKCSIKNIACNDCRQ